MNLGRVAVGVGGPDRWIVWADRGLLALGVVTGLAFLPRTIRELVRVAGWDRAGVGWPRRQGAAWLTMSLLLAIVGLGALFLPLDLSSRHPSHAGFSSGCRHLSGQSGGSGTKARPRRYISGGPG